MNKTLKSGRKVIIKEMSVDQIDACKDVVQIVFVGDDARTIGNMAKSRTAWIRAGLAGGDFKNWNSQQEKKVPDHVLKQLSDTEKEELALLIANAQNLGEEIPSDLPSTSS
tara:strand:- start:260 stop:592 length:333 start_codon:yes stop_codon:yes gene_type:complete